MIDPQIHEAKTALEQLSKDRMAQQLAFDRQLEINSHRRALEMAKEEGEARGEAKGRAEGEAKGRAEGEAKGRAEALARLLKHRGVPLSAAQREQILRCSDLAQLDRWFELGFSVTSADQLFE